MKTEQEATSVPQRGREVIHQHISTIEVETVPNHPGIAVLTVNKAGSETNFLVNESERENLSTMPDPFNNPGGYMLDDPQGLKSKPILFSVYERTPGDPFKTLPREVTREELLAGRYPRENILCVSGWDATVWHPDHKTPRSVDVSFNLWETYFDLDKALEILKVHPWVSSPEIIDNPVYQNVSISGERLLVGRVTAGQDWMDEMNKDVVTDLAYDYTKIVHSQALADNLQLSDLTGRMGDPLGLATSKNRSV